MSDVENADDAGSARTPEGEREIMEGAGSATERRRVAGMAATIGMPTERSDDFGTTVRRLGRLLGRQRAVLAVALGLTLVSVFLRVLGPKYLGDATDTIVTGVSTADGIDFGNLHRQLLLVLGLYAVSLVLSYIQAYLLAGVIQRSMQTLRAAVEDKLHRLPLSYVDRQPRGDLLSRVTNDIDNLAQSLQQTVSQVLVSVLTLIGIAAMMFVLSPLLAVVALITVPLALWVMRALGRRARPRYLDQWKYTGAVNAQVEETFTGHAIVTAFGRQREAETTFAETNDSLFESSFAAQFLVSLIQPAMMVVGNLQYVLIAVVGGLQITNGSMSIGEMQAFIQYARQFSQPLTQIASMATVFQSGIASLERVLEFLDAEEQTPEQEPTPDPPRLVGRIAFEDVSFSYDAEHHLIEGLSVVAEPGETVAIVGPTGAGKTTLVNLIMRFYDLDGGRITLDGRDIASFPRAELRSKVGMVLQDTWLFGGTIRDNIAYGNPAATEEQIQQAASDAYVDRFVSHLPDGYDTVINDEGDNIAAGERQLITIARAFLADPSILILDEATSSVDTRTEMLVQQAMNRLRTNRTSFVIAHRLSTIRGADVILVMENGAIVEQGDHDELLATGGAYARLYNAQFEGTDT